MAPQILPTYLTLLWKKPMIRSMMMLQLVALVELSVTTANESEMSTNDQVVCMEVAETSHTVTQFVGDNIDLNIVPIHGNISFHSMGWISHLSSTTCTFARSTDNRSCPQSEVEGT